MNDHRHWTDARILDIGSEENFSKHTKTLLAFGILESAITLDVNPVEDCCISQHGYH
jgi:hypothetical protein